MCSLADPSPLSAAAGEEFGGRAARHRHRGHCRPQRVRDRSPAVPGLLTYGGTQLFCCLAAGPLGRLRFNPAATLPRRSAAAWPAAAVGRVEGWGGSFALPSSLRGRAAASAARRRREPQALRGCTATHGPTSFTGAAKVRKRSRCRRSPAVTGRPSPSKMAGKRTS
jgi:hypothetical protein